MRSRPWPPGTYYFRASIDGGARRVCSVVLEPVLGAAHDSCSADDFPFRVQYRYDETEQAISSVSFGQLHSLQLEVLTSEDAPPLVQLDQRVTFPPATSLGCGTCSGSPAPLSVRVLEAGELADAGSADAGVPAADGGVRADDAGAGDAGSETAL